MTVLAGLAAVYGQWSEPLIDKQQRRYRERIDADAFVDSLISAGDLMLLWQHDDRYPLARTRNGTLQLWSDRVGLHFEAQLADTRAGSDAVAAVAAGLVGGASIAFADASVDTAYDAQQKMWLKTLRRARLTEISLVTMPAYRGTSVAIRLPATAAQRRRKRMEFKQRMLAWRLQQTQMLVDAYNFSEAT